jgi:hypothetical protein
MRCMIIVKANRDTEAGRPPTRELLEAMTRFNEELAKAGVMLAGEGLHPSSKGARTRFSGKDREVIGGPALPARPERDAMPYMLLIIEPVGQRRERTEEKVRRPGLSS